MAKNVRRKQLKQTKKSATSPFNIYWQKQNYHLLLLGIVIIVIGFYFMTIGPWDSFSSLVISPILLFIGYVIIFPLSIFFRKRSEREKSSEEKNAVSEG
jgi:membrane protein YdbS with pleckstrin-like domain